MPYEYLCPNCHQVYDEYTFLGRGVCGYCAGMLGLDHRFEKEEVAIFGTLGEGFLKRGED